MRLKVELTYRDEWIEVVEVEVPDGCTWEEACELRRQAGERHWPSPPPASRISPCNLVHAGWEGDPVFPLSSDRPGGSDA